VVPAWKRSDRLARALARLSPGFTWRWGLKDPYGWEQWVFWQRLWPRLQRGHYDILHVQDPMVALWCRRYRQAGRLGTREILAHGTEEPAGFLAGFPHVQHLAPWHAAEVQTGIPRGADKAWATLPNFVDTAVFRPVVDEVEREACRRQLGLPGNIWVAGCVAAVKKHHKRVDYLIREFAHLSAIHARMTSAGAAQGIKPFLLIAGSRTPESNELISLAGQLIPGQFKVVLEWPRERMPDLYRAMDVFVLTSLFEMMPIAVLEALASGIPVLANRHPVLKWMVGLDEPDRTAAGGACLDMSKEGELADTMARLTPSWLAICGRQARLRAEQVFAKNVVIGQYVEYYRSVKSEE
jgi:glycosyltransferase involved in cell wall biosynthesis